MDAGGTEWAGDDPWWEGPDALDLVCEVADMMSVFAADRFRRRTGCIVKRWRMPPVMVAG